MKKIILAAISAIALTAFMACSADALATNVDSTDTEGPSGVVSNKKADANPSMVAKSSSSSKKSSSSSAK